MNIIKLNLKKIYRSFTNLVLTFIFFISFTLIDYFLLTRTTSFERFLLDNSRLFVFLSILLSLINNLLIAIALTLLVFLIEKRKKTGGSTLTNNLLAIFFSLVSTGCAVCGGLLLPIFGIAASLTAFPFQGLEIKVISIFILLVSIYQMSLNLSSRFKKIQEKKGFVAWYLVGVLSLVIVYGLPRLPWSLKKNFFGSELVRKNIAFNKEDQQRENLFNEINPESGHEINASYGDLGPKMIETGVIDLEKFKQVYQQNGQPLTKEQLTILTQGSDKKIKITRDNSYFLLNFFWAVGLANRSKILTQGEITKYGAGQIGNFASTGGWTLAKSDPMNYYAKAVLIPLTPKQENLVEKVASRIYRPCCNNSTAFPDCNHGMALLAVLQLLASNGATEDQMFEAAKYFNAFWFPGNYYDLALYFKNKEGKKFSQVSGEVILGKDYSSASGWSQVKQWLADKGLIEQPPRQGGGCGV